MRGRHPTRRPGGASIRIPRGIGPLALGGLLVAMLLALGLATRPARADYPGHGPDENTSEAYGPLEGAHTYAATLNNNGSTPGDQDWYYFYVPKAGDKLHWTVSNTSSRCSPHLQPYYCHVYATLEDSTGHQLGGSGSTAGTSGALPGQTQYINWTFTSPGKYYIAFVGDGDTLNYQFSVTPASGVSTLNLKSHQSRRNVDISLVIPSAGARVLARLFAGTGASRYVAGKLSRSDVPKGPVHYAVRLGSRTWTALKARHHMKLLLRVTVTLSSGRVLQETQNVIVSRQ